MTSEALLPAVMKGGDEDGMRMRCLVNRLVEGEPMEEKLQ